MKVLKTEIRLRLSSESLNSVMRIRMKGLSTTEFKENTQMIALITGTTQILGASTNSKERNTRIRKQLRSSDQTLRLVTLKVTIQQLVDLVTKKINFLHFASSLFFCCATLRKVSFIFIT